MSHFTTLLRRIAAITVAGAIGLTATAQSTAGHADAQATRHMPTGVHLSPDATVKTHMDIVSRHPGNNGLRNLDIRHGLSHLMAKAPQNAAANADLPTLIGCVSSADSWPYTDPPIGIYELPKTAGGEFKLIAKGPDATGGGVAIDNSYFCVSYFYFGGYMISNTYEYDMETWKQLSKGDGEAGLVATDVALDPVTGNVYGFFYNDNATGYEFGIVNYKSYGRTAICSLDRTMVAIAIDSDGTIYGIDRKMERDQEGIQRVVSSSLYTVDRDTGALTLIGVTGQRPLYVSSAVIDPRTHRMFWAMHDGDHGYLCEVDKATGVATVLQQFADNESVCGLYIPAAEAEDDAPDAVENLEAVFAGGSLNGRVSFKAPASTFAGQPLGGELTYTVLANGHEAASGTTAPGATVNATVMLKTPGDYTFTAYVSNEAGDGPKVKTRAFAGFGKPSTPVITATFADNNFHVSWEPVTTTVDGGYINPDEVVYDIMLMPEQELLAHDLEETHFDLHYIEPTKFETHYFLVGARHTGNTDIQSVTGVSNLIMLGALDTPYEQTFDFIEDTHGYTVLDGNNDGKIWCWYNESVYLPYSKETDCDDWFITPPIRLEEGRTYSFSIDARAGYAAYPERFEVKFGKSNTAEAMTGSIIEPTVITNIVANTFSGMICPQESGTYYIGVHGISDMDMYSLHMDNLKVGSGLAEDAPAAVSDFSVIADPTGKHTVEISFTAPDKTFAGAPLQSLTEIRVTRNGRRMKVIENPACGEKYTLTDERPQAGYYTYEVTAVNEHGPSATVNSKVYVGINIPGSPTDATLVETSPGVVTISWKAPEYDADGLPLNPDNVTYTIVQATNHDQFILAEGIKETSWTGTVIEEGYQDFIYFGIAAETEAGISYNYASTPMMAIGTPEPYPFLESFADGDFKMDFGISGNGGSWSTYGDNSGFVSIEEDNGYMGMKGEYMDARSGIYSGKISLADAVNPVLSFYTYNIPPESSSDGHDTNRIEVMVTDNEKSVTVKDFVIGEEFGDNYGWNKVSIPITQFAGKDHIEIRLIVTTGNCVYTFFDRLRIGEAIGDNLIAGTLHTPDRVKSGNDITATMNVLNDGDNAAADYKVRLLCNGNELMAADGPELLPGQKKALTFTCPTGPTTDEKLVFTAIVTYSADAVADDNTSNNTEVTVIYPNLPAPGTLTGRQTDAGVKLEWAAPDMSLAQPAATEDDFESYAPYANTGVGQWTFVDLDKGGIGGIQEFQIPGIDRGSEQSYWIMNSDISTSKTFAAHSGKQYLCQMYSAIQMSPVPCDDWVITPELYGKKQEITFFARSYTGSLPETFEVYYSTGSVNPDDFEFLDIVEYVPGAWTEYNFTVPDGARRFAVRCISNDRFMLFIDDFSYIPVGSELDLEHQGYNLYRDDIKIKTLAASELSHIDIPDTEAAYRYHLTAVYNRGESRPTEAAEVDFSLGINDAAAAQPLVRGLDGMIEVSCADGLHVSIYAVDGKTVYTSEGNVTIALAAGVYTVRVADTSYKVLVK